MPHFSVVMATYGRGRHILPSILSVLNQDYGDFELLIVGDCCSDETEAVVRPFLSDRVKWFNLAERCGSQSFPNNEGIARSKGRYIAYLGHDDIWATGHLRSLAALFDADAQLDFAVGGAIFYGPPGSDFRMVTGIFSDPAAPLEHFLPPSGFAHRRDVTERIGPWAHPMEISAPVDADLLLRAARAGMRFQSTQRVTLHKYAAGHRYLSYLTHDSVEQEEMLRKTAAPGIDDEVAQAVERAKADGTFMIARHIDYETYGKGVLARKNAARKGNERPELRPLVRREVIVQDSLPRALDWREVYGPAPRIRWVHRNPQPKILLPLSTWGKVRIELTFAHSQAESLDRVILFVNGAPAELRLSLPQQREGHFESIGTATTTLRRRDISIAELHLTEAQRTRGSQLGLGVGDIVLTPIGLVAQYRRARSLAGRCWRGVKRLVERI